ncbi:hypothetical protein C4546_02990 [Candidatus Parcubacteria bacterium]|jgi:MFS family permease|nr:MAG: hypothetical protein C4546_02990 [Candidatus Parcubacteria bacterium]
MFPGHAQVLKKTAIPNKFVVIFLLWLALFGFYSFTAWNILDWPVFSSPDETANFIFAKEYENSSDLIIQSKPSANWRSIMNSQGILTPGSFVFFPAFLGMLGKFFGNLGILMIGPFLASLAVIFWWKLVKSLSGDKRMAWLASVILATLPIFWFYANRGLWQNGVFTSFLIINLFFLILAWKKRHWALSLATGLLWGVMLAIRPSEIIWLVSGLMVYCVFNFKKIPLKHLGWFSLGAFLPLGILFSLQGHTYGNLLSSSYRAEGVFTIQAEVNESSVFTKIKAIFFPFGVNPAKAFSTFYQEVVKPFWYFFVLGVPGLILFFFRWRQWPDLRRFVLYGLISVFFLIVLYGNYQFIEYPALSKPTLDSSYFRYWLPVLVFLCLGNAKILAEIFQLQNRFYKLVASALLIGVLGFGLVLIWNSEIGIKENFTKFELWQKQSRWLYANTPVNAVVIGTDKLIFPPRTAVGYNGFQIPLDRINAQTLAAGEVYVFLANPAELARLKLNLPEFNFSEILPGPGDSGLVKVE